jgi:hypothetical protein
VRIDDPGELCRGTPAAGTGEIVGAVQFLSVGCATFLCLSAFLAACLAAAARRVRQLRTANRCLADALREQLHARDRHLARRRHVIRAGDGLAWQEVDRARAEELLLAMAAAPGAFDGAVVAEIEG